jgi:alcohol dehydrogenase (cytochrome c)
MPPTFSLHSTDGDLVFIGPPNGRFAAHDAETLKEVWSFNLGTPITAPPMAYAVGGKQFIAVVAGGTTAGSVGRSVGLYQPSAIVAVFGL